MNTENELKIKKKIKKIDNFYERAFFPALICYIILVIASLICLLLLPELKEYILTAITILMIKYFTINWLPIILIIHYNYKLINL